MLGAGEFALASPARTGSPASIVEITFSFFLCDIGYLPFDSNFTKVGVSRYIDTNGISALNNLASAYKAVKQYDKAILTYKEALSIIESKYGPDSPVILLAPTLNNFANLYHGLRKYIEAKNLYERAIRLIENDTTYGPDNRNLGPSLTGFAALQNDLGNYPEAQSLCERALLIGEKVFGADAIQLVSTLEHYANALERNGLASKAVEVKSRLNRIRKRAN